MIWVVAVCTSTLSEGSLMFDVLMNIFQVFSMASRALKSLIRNTLLCNEWCNVELLLKTHKDCKPQVKQKNFPFEKCAHKSIFD